MDQIEDTRRWCIAQALVVVDMATRMVPIGNPETITEGVLDVAKEFEKYIYNEEEK